MQMLEGSRAVALVINNIKPDVVSAYPITPQTHIVEDLAKFKADGKADYEYVRAESEFAAASIVEGACATGSRVYTATSSQGLLLMTEVLFNIAGMRLPVVLTCANRGVSAPITIWNDHQDAMTVRDSGWIMFFAENHEEAVKQHILAYKVAEKLRLPVMVNIDGFILTHSYEAVTIPTKEQIKKFLPKYSPKKGEYLDTKNPVTMGAFAAPGYYMEIREKLQDDLLKSEDVIKSEYSAYEKIIGSSKDSEKADIDNGLIEYTGPARPKTIIVAMGSVIGTIKEVIKEKNGSRFGFGDKIGILKIKTFRPLPKKEIINVLSKSKNVAIIEKAISLGNIGPLAAEIKSLMAQKKTLVKSFVLGLGGRDITKDKIKKVIERAKDEKDKNEAIFIG